MWRAEWQGWNRGAAVSVVAIRVGTANSPERPSRRIASARDAVCAGLEEVYQVLREAVDTAGEYHEKLQQDAAG